MNAHHEKGILCKVKAAHGPPDEEEAFEPKRLFLPHETVEKDMENICKKIENISSKTYDAAARPFSRTFCIDGKIFASHNTLSSPLLT